MKPKILIFNTLYSPYQIGGAEKSVQLLAEELVNNNYEIHVACLGPENKTDFINGVKVHYFKTPNLFWIGSKKNHSSMKKLLWHLIDRWNPLAYLKFKTFIKDLAPDVIHTNNLGGFSSSIWSAAHSLNIKTVHTLRDYYLSCPKTTRYSNDVICETPCSSCIFFSKPKVKASQKVNNVVGISQFILDQHLSENYFQNSNSQKVIYNSINPDTSSQIVKEKSFSNVFGFMGQLVNSKGIELIIDAFNQCPEAKLLIFGKTNSSEYLKHLKAKANSNIEFCGFKKPDEIFNSINYLCVPSLWNEPFGRVIIEANSYGVPVLAAPNGGIPELIENGKNGWLLKNDEWEEKIKDLLNNKNVQNYQFGNSKAPYSYTEFYSQLLNS